jgi:hypothetical protein
VLTENNPFLPKKDGLNIFSGFKRAVLILFQNFPPKGNQFFYDPNYHDPSYEYGGYGFTGQMNPFSNYSPHGGQFPHHQAPPTQLHNIPRTPPTLNCTSLSNTSFNCHKFTSTKPINDCQ